MEPYKKKHESIIQKIVIERLRVMPKSVSVSLGSDIGFLSRDDLIKEVNNNTEIGKKILEIQYNYMKALKKGLFKKEKE